MKTDKMIKNLFLSYLVVFALVEFTNKVSQIVNTFMVSRLLGDLELAAYGLTSPYTTLIEIFSGILSVGAQYLCTKFLGSFQKDKSNQVFSYSILVAVIVSVLVGLCFFVFSNSICIFLGAGSSGSIFEALNNYNRIFCFGIPAMVLFALLSIFINLDGNKKLIIVASLVLTVSCIVCNYIFAGVLGMGLFGFGLGGVISEYLALMVLLTNFIRKDTMFKLVAPSLEREYRTKLFNVGLPKLTRKIATTIKKIYLAKLCLMAGGTTFMAVMSLQNSLFDFYLCFSAGISGALVIMTQVYSEEEDEASIKKTGSFALGVFMLIMGGLSLITVLFAGNIVSFFKVDPENVKTTVTAIAIAGGSLTLISFNEITFDFLQGMKRLNIAHVFIVFQRLFILAVAYFMIKLVGPNGLWIALILGEIPVTIAYLIYIIADGRKKGLDAFESIMLITTEIKNKTVVTFSRVFKKLEDLKMLYHDVEQFLKESMIGNNTTAIHHIALASEELVSNVVEHGFTKTSKLCECNLKINLEKDDVKIIVRDDCPKFNIKERYNSVDQNDISHNIGIRIIYALTDNIEYSTILNTNTLEITMCVDGKRNEKKWKKSEE